MRFRGRLGARKFRGACRVGADRGDVYHPANAGLHAGVKQRAGRGLLHTLHVVAPSILKDADAIHHRVDAVQQRQPRFRPVKPKEIGFNP